MQDKIIFLDIDGVLNDHSANSIYSENSTNINMINCLNLALEKTGAKVIIISNWAQVMSFDKLINFLTERGVWKNSIIDIITPKEIEENGIVQYVIDKGAFICECVKTNSILNYVVVDDDFNSELIDPKKIISTNGLLGVTEKEVEKIINLLNK